MALHLSFVHFVLLAAVLAGVSTAAGNDGSFPTDMTLYNGLLWFGADDGKSGRELWTTDGYTRVDSA